MPVKIFDIIPPSEKYSKRNGNHNHFKAKNTEYEESAIGFGSRETKRKKKNPLVFQLFFVFSFILIIIAGVVYISSTTKSKVNIWPKFDEVTLTKKIILTENYNETDPKVWLEKGMMPAKIFVDSRTAVADFSGSGVVKKDIKAQGTIRVYNNYSGSEQSLVVGTRLVSENGKIFKTISKATIPGKKTENGKTVPGEVDIKVEAAETGEAYNIGPSTFSIPGFAGSEKYTGFYGKSLSAMSGGIKGEVAQVTDSDLAKANSQLFDKAGQESRQFLLKNVPADYVFINEDKAVYQEATEKSHTAEIGKEADSFNAKMTVKSTVLIFKKAEIEDLANRFISSSISEGKAIDAKTLKIEYSAEKNISLLDKKPEEELNKKKVEVVQSPITMEMSIVIKFRVYSSMDVNQIKKTLLGKSINDARSILKTNEGVEKIEIDIGPIWRQKLPENMDKLDINLNI